jgi:hypothetical protein
MLLPILDWLFQQHCSEYSVDGAWADLGRLPRPPKTLPEKITVTLDLYPCDILFIHQDAEKESLDVRLRQISEATQGLNYPPVICVIPVRMQEAWLLFDKAAIRRAAGNPNGLISLNLPSPKKVESLPDPKALLFELIRKASNLKGARLKKMNLHKYAFLVSQAITDFSPLRPVQAFCSFEKSMLVILANSGYLLPGAKE